MKKIPLAALACARGLVGGPFGSSLVSADYTDEGIPVIRGANLSAGKYVDGDFAFVSPEKFEKDLSRNSALAGDIVFTQRGTLGQVAIVPEAPYEIYVVSQSQMRLRADSTKAHREFVYYAATTPDFLRQIDDRAISTGVPHTNLGILAELEIPDMPLAEQRAIAEVLGALDDKIAANTKLAATADELAGLMYDAAVRGWRRVPLSDLLIPILGGTPSRSNSEYWNPANDLWISAKDITAAPNRVVLDTAEKISPLATRSTKAKPLPAGSVILTARGTVGSVARLAQPAAFNQSCYGFAPGVVPAEVLFYSVLRAAEHAKKIAHGSVFDTITKATFNHLEMAWDEGAVSELNSQLAPLHRKIDVALQENRTLAATRDALLPQLMSGKLRVRDAEKIASEAGA